MPFVEPIVDGVLSCWSCGRKMRAPDSDILARMACVTCRHCGATIWIWSPKEVDGDDSSLPI